MPGLLLAAVAVSTGCGSRVEQPAARGAGIYPEQAPLQTSQLVEDIERAAGRRYQALGDERPLDQRPDVRDRLAALRRAVRRKEWQHADDLARELQAILETYAAGIRDHRRALALEVGP